MSENPIENPFSLLHGPLNADDIEFIEEGINELIRHLFPPGEARDEALAMELIDKIDEYIGIVDYAEKDPDLNPGPELGEGLRKLRNLVNEYHHRLN